MMEKTKSQTLRSREDKYLAPGLQNLAIQSGIAVESAKGCRVTDVDGNSYIDLIGGIGVNGIGHSHPKFIKAIQEQVEKASIGSFTSRVRVEFFERLAKYHPEPGEYVIQLYSSGAEAVESALRLAKSYTKKYEFAAFSGGFHGKTMGALGLMGSTFKEQMGPMLSGNHVLPYANCYRCSLDLTPDSCAMACAKLGRDQLKMNSTGAVAAFIVEPIQGTAGNVIPPKEWLGHVKSMADANKALLIVDEMITGFGRTGRFWGWEHSGVKPDIITMGKQFGGGFPISAVLAKREIAQAKPWANPSGSSSSYGGNPLAAAAANATLEIIEEEELVARSHRMGEYFLSKLKPFEKKYSFVGEVRGVGLMIGVELVQDKESKTPLDSKTTMQIFQRCVSEGLLTMAYAPQFRIQPPLVIDEATIDEAVEILDQVFSEVAEAR